MNRREFVIAGAGIACVPSYPFAQTGTKRIGWLDYSSAAENLGIFVQAMTARGWIEGRTFNVLYRGGEGRGERMARAAADLARLPADLIVAPGNVEALAAQKATDSIPIVMMGVDDPV